MILKNGKRDGSKGNDVMISNIRYQQNEGFTLIEIIVSIAILGIITVSVMGLLSNSLVHVFSSGKKDEAITRAANKMESLYQTNPTSKNDLSLGSAAKQVNDCSQSGGLYNKTDKNIIRYCIKTKEDGFKVTIVAFYMNGKKHVTLTSFIRKREG